MTAERDGKSRRTGQPDLLASLPDERPPASQPAPGIDPAAIEELLTGVRDLREQVAGLREAESAERPAPVTPEALEAWGDRLVARVAEAARTADAPADDEVVARIGRIQEAVAEAAAAVERNNGVLNSIGNERAAATERMKSAVARMETDLATTRAPITRETRRANPTLGGSRTRVAGLRFGSWTMLACLFFFVFGMLVESRTHLFYLWLWAG